MNQIFATGRVSCTDDIQGSVRVGDDGGGDSGNSGNTAAEFIDQLDLPLIRNGSSASMKLTLS